MLDCPCPLGDIPTIDPEDCIQEFLKDSKWIFQKLDDTNNTFVNGTNGISEATSWDPLPDATGDTKISITPELEEVSIAEPGFLEDSENADGAPFQVDSEPTVFDAIFRLPTPDQYTALKQMTCHKNLTVYRIDSAGKFAAREVTTNTYAGFIISPGTFNVSEPFKSGTGKVDQLKIRIRFVLATGYYSEYAVIAPEAGFNPRFDIKPTP